MAAEVTVGPLDASDVGELLTLQRAAYVTEAQIHADPNLPALVQTLDELREELATALGLKAVAGTRMVGSVRGHISGTTLQIGRLVVAPDWQGRGVATRLLTAIESATDASTAALFTGARSTANLRLYRRLGYLEQRRELLNASITLVHLTKSLDQSPAP